MGTFQFGALILFAAGQWDIRSHFHKGHRHLGSMEHITMIALKAAYYLFFFLSAYIFTVLLLCVGLAVT